ncbi:MAG: protein kinase [Archangium sp.]|nr:protein kinase [Archangium sp.]
MGSEPITTVKMPMPEQIIAGKYRIISRIGSGGMGLVFLAERLGVGNKVALKFLDPEPNDDDTRIQRFLREAKVGLEVQHPGAAQVLDLGRDEEMRLYLAFELVEGEDLRELIKREGRLRFGEAREIALQVAQVLAFAHGRGIVHRDVKPENVRVRRDLGGVHVKMLDFGIARLLKDTGVRLTAEGMLAGTPRYMAPEQVKDEPLDGRTDQYALGLMFFEMLTGAVAIGGKNVTQILMHQMQTVVPPLGFVDPGLSNAPIDAFIARACAKEPAHRFPTMAEFITALKALMVDERAWPGPKTPPASSVHVAPTKENKGQPLAELVISDTLIRVPERTQLERRLEVPTDPVREPVHRKSSPDGATAPLPAHIPQAPVLVPLPLALQGNEPSTEHPLRDYRPPPVMDRTVKEGSGRARAAPNLAADLLTTPPAAPHELPSGPQPQPLHQPQPQLQPQHTRLAPQHPKASAPLELPTDPERPMVARMGAIPDSAAARQQRPTVASQGNNSGNPGSVGAEPKERVIGVPVPSSPSAMEEPLEPIPRSRGAWWLLGVLLGLASLAGAWWWWTHR